jgi:hypothetical protein
MTSTSLFVSSGLEDVSIGSVGTSPVALVAADPGRRYLFIHNPQAIFLGIAPTGTSPAVTSNVGTAGTLIIPPYSSLVFEASYMATNGWSVVADSGAGNVVTVYVGH